MMEKSNHRCKLCFRSFANGRALGGHMRSHMMKYYAAKKKEEEEQPLDDFQSYSSSSSSEDEEGSEEVEGLLSYELREDVPKKSTLLVDHHEFLPVVLDQDRESETDPNSICRRSKRVRKSRVSDFDGLVEHEPVSSISDTTPEEHVAHCLIMLSRDKWKREEIIEEEEEEEEEEEKFRDDNYSKDSGVVKVKRTKVRGKYRCEACNKLFRSYQALGGHRASHKKIKVSTAAPPQAAEKMGNSRCGLPPPAVVVEEKIHECPFCHRIFSSGQALGGHKRSHFVGAGAISSANAISPVKQSSRTGETLNIDLNLPAPVDDDDNSQIAVSAVSDAELL